MAITYKKRRPTIGKQNKTTRQNGGTTHPPSKVDQLLQGLLTAMDHEKTEKSWAVIKSHKLDEVPISPLLLHIPKPIEKWCKNKKNWSSITQYDIEIKIPEDEFSSTMGGHFQVFLLLPHSADLKEKKNPDVEKMLHYITLWYRIALSQSPPTCSGAFRVFLYLTPFSKELPRNSESKELPKRSENRNSESKELPKRSENRNSESKELPKSGELGQINVNTALTTSGCGNDTKENDIVIFRWEEWFKALLHESFHKLGLDDSTEEEHDEDLSAHIQERSKVVSKESLGVYEAYTETWAEILNLLFYVHDTQNKKTDLSHFKKLLQKEQQFSREQRRKIEDYNKKGDVVYYEQDIKIHSYYTLKQILLQNYRLFLQWCLENNGDAFPMRKNRQATSEYKHFWSVLLSRDVPVPRNRPYTNRSLRMTNTELDWF